MGIAVGNRRVYRELLAEETDCKRSMRHMHEDARMIRSRARLQ